MMQGSTDEDEKRTGEEVEERLQELNDTIGTGAAPVMPDEDELNDRLERHEFFDMETDDLKIFVLKNANGGRGVGTLVVSARSFDNVPLIARAEGVEGYDDNWVYTRDASHVKVSGYTRVWELQDEYLLSNLESEKRDYDGRDGEVVLHQEWYE